MWIEKTSQLTKKVNKLDINITRDQLYRINNRFKTKELIQNIVPDLPIPEREFLISGITPEEWQAEFGNRDDCDDDEKGYQTTAKSEGGVN